MSAPRPLPWPVPWSSWLTAQARRSGVTLDGIAAVLGVPRATVDTWRHRGRAGVPFPEPAHAGTRPRWTPAQVSGWVRAVLDVEASR